MEALDRIRVRVAESTSPAARTGTHRRLYDYQEEAVAAWLRARGRGLLAMCTGSGKTITALAAVGRLGHQLATISTEPIATVVACPTRVLVDQWAEAIESEVAGAAILKAYEDATAYAAALPAYLRPAPGAAPTFVITTYESLTSTVLRAQIHRAVERGSRVLLVADEAHRLSSAARLDAVEQLTPRLEAVLALTATPEVEDEPARTERLLSLFGGIVYEYPLERAIEQGILCPYRYFPRPVFLDPEVSATYVRLLLLEEAGSSQEVLSAYREKRELLRRCGHYVAELDRLVSELRASGSDMSRTVVFSPPGRADPGDEHRILARVKAVFEGHGMTCTGITADTPGADRPVIVGAFANGTYDVLLGIGCLDEGLDVPGTQRAIVLYSVDREKQFIQRRGRVLRRAPGKECADIFDLILLPHGAALPPGRAEALVRKETRRHRTFSEAALNREEALAALDSALNAVGGARV
jgi:superfamily II DNA or RNA helicase